MEADNSQRPVLLLHWSLVIISETKQYCDQDTVPHVQTCSLPPVPLPAAVLAWFLCVEEGCSIKPHWETLTETQPSQALQTVRSPALETWRNCSPQKTHCSWKHPLRWFVPCFFHLRGFLCPNTHHLFCKGRCNLLGEEFEKAPWALWFSPPSYMAMLHRWVHPSLPVPRGKWCHSTAAAASLRKSNH